VLAAGGDPGPGRGWAGMTGAVMTGEERSRGFTAGSVPGGYDRYMSAQLFEPWAREFVGRAGLVAGTSVLDVASGPGAVARVAAAAAGAGGRVVASDISPAMLAVAAAKPAGPGWAPIEYLECPATAITAAADSFDAVLCQQGLQFFPDRQGSVQEMRRVARPGGVVQVSTWASEHPLGLFGPMTEVLAEAGVAEPFPRAFDSQSFCLSAGELRGLLAGAGLRDVRVETAWVDAMWATADDAAAALTGTPYGPAVAALPGHLQQRIRAQLAARLGPAPDGTVTVRTTSHIARGIK
jgi:ubiquinone/menaquinone biosynthesis C-methylase UbiE